ncbi:MAG TPA: transcription antitermination factor NusB, partial [Firmicutes bacterium]|nr:transcription antitermination factor NusB [Bacillota bacterium]
KRMTRRDSRILALCALFCWHVGKMDPDESFDLLASEARQEFMADSGNIEYARELVGTTVSRVQEIDAAIDQVSQGWPVSRMPRVDLLIIRLAYAEGLIVKGAPMEVVLDEAIELSKEYSSHASPKFVNGVLMGLFRKMGWSGDSAKRYNI